MSEYEVDNIAPARQPLAPAGVPSYQTADGEFWVKGRNSMVTDKPRLYKLLTGDGKSPIALKDFEWPLPTTNPDGSVTPGDWLGMTGEIEACVRGLHAFDGKQYREWEGNGARLFEIEFDGPIALVGNKYVGARARLVREIPMTAFTTARDVLHYGVNPATAAIEEAKRAVKAKFRTEYDAKVLGDSIAAFDASKFGARADEAKAAYVESRDAWALFIDTLIRDQSRVDQLVNAYEAMKNVPGAPTKPTELTALRNELGNAVVATRNITRPGTPARPYETATMTFEQVEKVGVDWYMKYLSRFRKAMDKAIADATAEFASNPTPKTFDEIVDSL